MKPSHKNTNAACAWNDPETFANPATAGLPCSCPTSRKPKRILETDYVRAIMKRTDTAFQSVKLFRRPAGGTLQLARGDWIRAGIPGQADLYALKDGGQHYEIEVKRGTHLSPNQERWREWCVNRGIPWALLDVHEGEMPAQTVERWVGELRDFFGLGDGRRSKT